MVPPAGRTSADMVGDDGLEPPTFCVYDRRSDQPSQSPTSGRPGWLRGVDGAAGSPPRPREVGLAVQRMFGHARHSGPD